MACGIVAKMRRMETPYGEIPDRFARDMRPQEMHDFLRQSYGRRNVLKGAATLGVAAIAGPMLWRQRTSLAPMPPGPQWIAFGADPRSQMYLSWSAGRDMGKEQIPAAPQVRWGLDASYGIATRPSLPWYRSRRQWPATLLSPLSTPSTTASC